MSSKLVFLFCVILSIGLTYCHPTPLEIDDEENPSQTQFLDEYQVDAHNHFLEERDLNGKDEEILVRERRQLFGGRSGNNHQLGYRAGPAWGSMSHSGGPITYSGGAAVGPSNGPNAYAGIAKTPSFPSSRFIGGSVPLHTGKDSSLTLSGQRTFNPGMKPSNDFSLNYHKSF